MKSKKREEILGKKFSTNTSDDCIVIDYSGTYDVTVQFCTYPCIVSCRLGNLIRGEVKNPMFPSFYEKGYIGLGEYSFKEKAYSRLWNKVLLRAYCEKNSTEHATYEDVEVCDEWLNFQNFAAWCDTQEFFNTKDDKGRSYHLDKDIITKGNKIYSPDTCCFVPQYVNKLLSKRDKMRGEYLVGVTYEKKCSRYIAGMSVFGKHKHIGSFDTEFEAFQAYKKAKEAYIKEVAEEWKDRIDERVYQALLNYEVHIDD